MRIFILATLIISSFAFSQKKKYKLDVVSNIDAKVIALYSYLTNALAKNLEPFY